MAESDQNGDILLELKSAVLNIDWEISDETLDELSQEVAKLQSEWAGQKVLLVYLQIIGALCQYIRTSREKSHPGTFSLLREAFEGLEALVLDPGMAQAEKNKTVMGYADRYNNLKKEIVAGNFIPGPAKEEVDEESTLDMLMEVEDEHSTDTIFDSMLNTMVHAPDDGESTAAVGSTEAVESEPEAPPEVPATPPARPAVQAAFNKADGTEVDPDRNEDDEFAEADELLDDFFDDDDIPAPGTATLADDNETVELEDGQDADEDEGGLSIDLDDSSYQEIEETLDDFFGDDEGDDLLDPVVDEDDSLIDDALDDFFDDEDQVSPRLSDSSEDVGAGGSVELETTEGVSPLAEAVACDEEDAAGEIVIDYEEPETREAVSPLIVPSDETATEFVVDAADLDEPDSMEADAAHDATCVENLQRLLLSVEWEVDDQLLLRLEEEIDSLGIVLKDNPTAGIHLNLLGSVISYIGREQADMISDSMTCLKLVADSLESLMADQTGDASSYGEGAVRSFVDWHELIVLDLEKRLAQPAGNAEAVSGVTVERDAPLVDSSPSPEMLEMKESILKVVRELVAQELADSKG